MRITHPLNKVHYCEEGNEDVHGSLISVYIDVFLFPNHFQSLYVILLYHDLSSWFPVLPQRAVISCSFSMLNVFSRQRSKSMQERSALTPTVSQSCCGWPGKASSPLCLLNGSLGKKGERSYGSSYKCLKFYGIVLQLR